MFDNDYQTNVLMSDNQTLYINNVRLGGILVHMFGIRGVDIHSQLRMIFIIATHQLNTYTTNPLPIQTQSNPYYPYTYRSIVHLPFSYRPIVLPFTHTPPPPYFS